MRRPSSKDPLFPDSDASPEALVEINTTPLIDVMLVLLIMLIITIPVQTHQVVLDMPNGPPPADSTRPEVVTVEIDFDGTVLWNGQVIADAAELESRLKAVASAANQPEVHLRPNKLAPYGDVAAVLAATQRLGIQRLGIVGGEQFSP
jgi:biopolymer transport protein ExbD